MMAQRANYMDPRLPWSIDRNEEERFKRIVTRVGIFFLVIALFVGIPDAIKQEDKPIEELPPRLAKLIVDKPKPPPPPKEKPADEAKKPKPKKEKPKPKAKPKPNKRVAKKDPNAARVRASQSGVLAFASELAELRDDSIVEKVQSNRSLSRSGKQKTKSSQRNIVTQDVTKGSTGIKTAKVSRDIGNTQLKGRKTTKVSTPAGGIGADGKGKVGKGGQKKRNRADILLALDRHKAAFNKIYTRYLRSHPEVQGKVVFRFKILPSGQVVDCKIVSSELSSPALERKLIARFKIINFGNSDTATEVFVYPVDFLPQT